MGIFRKKRQANRRRNQVRKTKSKVRQIEMLEPRQLMAVDLGHSVFSPDAFIESMDYLYEGNLMGSAYSVNYNGVANADVGFDGWARSSTDSPQLLFLPTTRIEVASVSKIITTVATLQLLENVYGDVDYGLDRPLMSFLPTDWSTGDNVEWITMRHLLRHTSGYGEGGNNDATNEAGINFESFGNNNWANLQSLLAQDHSANGAVADPEYVTPRWPRRYNNANFTILAKVVIPKLLNMDKDFTAKALTDEGITDADAHTGQIYADYVRENVLEPLGILAPSMNINQGSSANALAYSGPNDTAPGKVMPDDQDNGGAFGWKLSANDLGRFLHGMEHDNSILSNSARQYMKAEELGWAPQSSGDGSAQRIINAFGPIYNHGGLKGFTGGARMKSEIMVFPGGIEAAAVINSQLDQLPVGGLDDTMHIAYTDGWTDIVFDGTDGDDAFEINLNNVLGRPVLELVMGGNIQFSHWIDTLDSLTINGLTGNDTFDIDALPDGVELVINGGLNNDVVNVSATAGNLETLPHLTFNGNSGVDTFTINDVNNPYSLDLNHRYNITSTRLWRGAASGDPADPIGEAGVDYSGIEHLTLTTGNQANDVFVAGAAGISTTINAGNDNDTLWVTPFQGNIDLAAGLQFNGGNGTDTVLINDSNNPYDTALNSQYTVTAEEVSRFGSHPSKLVPFLTKSIGFDDVEDLTLYTGVQGDLVSVESTPSGETIIETGAGSDTLHVTPTAKNMELAAGLTYNAGTGANDTLIVHDENNPYETIINRPYSVTPVSLSRYEGHPGFWLGVPVGINYSNIQTLELNTSEDDDTINVHGLRLLGSTNTIDATFNTGGGDDTLVTTPVDGNIEFVDGLVFNGGEGTDAVVVHDENNPYTHNQSNVYAVSEGHVSRRAPMPTAPQWFVTVGVDINDVEDVTLHAGTGADEITVVQPGALETVNIYGGNPTRAPGDVLELIAPDGAVTGLVPSDTEYGAGLAVIDGTTINYWEIETVDSDFPTPNPGSDAQADFDGNGVINNGDLHHPALGWHHRFGHGLDGSHFLHWQRNFGNKATEDYEIVTPGGRFDLQEYPREEPVTSEPLVGEKTSQELLVENTDVDNAPLPTTTSIQDLVLEFMLSDSLVLAAQDEVLTDEPTQLVESYDSRDMLATSTSLVDTSDEGSYQVSESLASDFEAEFAREQDDAIDAAFADYDPLAMLIR